MTRVKSHRFGKGNSALRFYQVKSGLSTDQVCKCLNTTLKTYKSWLNEPYLIRMKDLYLLSGLYNVNVYELWEAINRNIPQVTDNEKWFINDGVNSYLSNKDRIDSFNKPK